MIHGGGEIGMDDVFRIASMPQCLTINSILWLSHLRVQPDTMMDQILLHVCLACVTALSGQSVLDLFDNQIPMIISRDVIILV